MDYKFERDGTLVLRVSRLDFEQLYGEPLSDEGWLLITQTPRWKEIAEKVGVAAVEHIVEMVEEMKGG